MVASLFAIWLFGQLGQSLRRSLDDALASNRELREVQAPERLEDVFERFWRGRATQAPGTGLGLYIARRLVEAHGGGIRAESEPGVGTAFSFWLPLADGKPGA